jgi:type IV pilus assembly protein PilE
MKNSGRHSGRSAGFSLIEILTVIAILSILAAIALPSYTSYVARARRADARTQLLLASQFMQRFYAANDSYLQDRAGGAVLEQVPEAMRRAPSEGAIIYRLEIPVAKLTVSSFELRMVPEVGGAMAYDKCGAFTVNSIGARGVFVSGAPGSVALRDECWK